MVNVAGAVVLKNTATPSTPPSGEFSLYSKTDRRVYTLDESGTENLLGFGLYPFTPDDQGMIAWNVDPCLISAGAVGDNAVAAGVANYIAINIPKAATITNFHMHVSIAGTAVTNSFVGLYTAAGVRVALSADQSTNWSTAAHRIVAFTSTYVAIPGRYYVGILYGAATSLRFARAGNAISSALYNTGAAAANSNLRTGILGSSLTALPTSFTVTSLAASGELPWVGLS